MKNSILIPDKNSNWLGVPASLTAVSLTLPKRLTYEQWAEIGGKIGRVKKFCTWALSDWLNFGEAHYGETYTQAVALTEYQPEYLAIIKHVGARIDPVRRRESLSFSHHKAVAMLEPEDQEKFLAKAEKNGWTRDELAAAVKEFTGGKSSRSIASKSDLTALPGSPGPMPPVPATPKPETEAEKPSPREIGQTFAHKIRAMLEKLTPTQRHDVIFWIRAALDEYADDEQGETSTGAMEGADHAKRD